MTRFTDIVGSVEKNYLARIAGTAVVHSLPRETIVKMMSVDEKSRIIILNKHFVSAPSQFVLDRGRHCPYCGLWKNGGQVSFLTTDEALVEGNHFLCTSLDESKEKAENTFFEDQEEMRFLHRREYTEEFLFHARLDDVGRWRTRYPAYVNLDRVDDSIGGSAWNGSLTRWFEAGFTTRIRFGVEFGLFPEDGSHV